MRDLVAGVVAVLLLVVAASLATTLNVYRRRREAVRAAERAKGRAVIVEVPGETDLVLFCEDDSRFYFGGRSIEKASIQAVRVLINGSPIASSVSRRHGPDAQLPPTVFEDRPEGIARDRWDVAIEAVPGTLLVECGAIRERVSQELARKVFDAVKADIERRDGKSPQGRRDTELN